MEQLTPTQEALAARLQACIDDPMWADHAEVSKKTLREVVAALSQPAVGAQPRTCSDERPCIPCYTDQGSCLGPAESAPTGTQPLPAQPETASKMPLPIALRLLASQIKADNGLRDNQGLHHRLLEEAASALTTPAPSEPAQPVPTGKWEGAEEWMPLAWELCANECGEEACTELVWEGGPVPEPWGDRWLKYESQAREMIAMVRKHVPQPAQASTQVPVRWLVGAADEPLSEAATWGHYPTPEELATIGIEVVITPLYASPVTPGEPAGAQAAREAWKPVCRYISDTLESGSAAERTVARTVMHLLPIDNLTTLAAIPEAKEKPCDRSGG
jgi:hypothetical protein